MIDLPKEKEICMTKIILEEMRLDTFPWYISDGIHVKGQFCIDGCFYNKKNFCAFKEWFLNEIGNTAFSDIVSRMNGNFSLIYQTEEATWLGVDIARSLPLFYSAEKGIVSDNAEALRKACEISKEDIDIRCLGELLLLGYNMLNNTAYKLIKQVDLGQVVCIRKDKCEAIYYYNHMAEIKPKTYEMQYIKKVAQQLGYRWYGIEYTDEVGKQFASKNVEEYLLTGNNHSSTPHMPHFMAVEYLIKNKLIDDDAVFLTGFCGDLPTGSFVFDKAIEERLTFSKGFLVDFFAQNEYFNYECPDSVLDIYKSEIAERIEQLGDISDFQTFIQIHDAIFIAARPSKLVCNANRLFEFWGHEWLLPMWDKEYLDYWYSLDLENRREQAVYRKYLCETFIKKYDMIMRSDGTHSMPWYFRKQNCKIRIKHTIGSLVFKIIYSLGIPLRRKLDSDNDIIIAMAFYKKIRYKRAVNFKGININTVYACMAV